MPLHRAAFTHRRFYAGKPLHRAPFTQRHFTHADAFTQSSFYTQKLLHREQPQRPTLRRPSRLPRGARLYGDSASAFSRGVPASRDPMETLQICACHVATASSVQPRRPTSRDSIRRLSKCRQVALAAAAYIFWHSILAFFLTFYSDILLWHFTWHLFWHRIWHPFWHLFWHFLWHSIWHSFW